MALQRAPQPSFSSACALGARRHVVREALEVVAPLALGMVHREVGVAQQRVCVLVVPPDRPPGRCSPRGRARWPETSARSAPRSSRRCGRPARFRRSRQAPRAARRTRRRPAAPGYRCCAGTTAGRAPTSVSTRSPTACPSASLISLKLSRSRIITASRPPLAVGARDGVLRRSVSSARFGRPVSDRSA